MHERPVQTMFTLYVLIAPLTSWRNCAMLEDSDIVDVIRNSVLWYSVVTPKLAGAMLDTHIRRFR